MQRLFENKRLVLFVAILGLVCLVLLAGAIKDIEFRPAAPLGGSRREQSFQAVNLGELVKQAAEVPFWKQAVFMGMLFVLMVLAASLLNPELRKKLILSFIRFVIFIFLFLYLIRDNSGSFSEILDQLTLPGNLFSNPQAADIPPPVFQPPQISGWLTFFVGFGFVLVMTLSLWRFGRSWDRIKQLFSSPHPLDGIARVARTSLGNLKSGGDFEHAIIGCYARMSAVLVEKKGLQREVAMTPNEFAGRLTKAGLPRGPVNKLTRLFETVRYGGQHLGQPEIDEAMLSLTTILRYCGEDV